MKRQSSKRRIVQTLDQDTLASLLLALAPVAPDEKRSRELRARVLEQVRSAGRSEAGAYLTVRAGEGAWVALTERVTMKVLHSTGPGKSFLLRLEPGAALPAHDHAADEECLVLEGEVWLGDIHVHAGDYHLAPKGTPHGVVISPTGALLFIRSGYADEYREQPA